MMARNLSRQLLAGAGLALALAASGCEREGTWAPTRTVAANVEIDNGISLNGISLNGVSLNGVSLNGVSLNGVSLNGVSLNGVSLNGVSLNGTSLNGVSLNGTTLTGAGLVGAQLSATLSSGESLPMRIDNVNTSSGLTWYRVSYQTGGAWAPLCKDASGATTDALALSGRWDPRVGVPGGGAHLDEPNVITFACKGYALAKCVELGYQPWATVNGASLRPYHQACTRAMRADYCGDGASWTFDGWKLDVADSLNIQRELPNRGTWVFEGVWNADGALCLNKYRAAELVASGDLPSCLLSRVSSSCTGREAGTLVRNSYNTMSVTAPMSAASKRASSGSSLQKGLAAATSKTQSAAIRATSNSSSERLKAIDDLKAAVSEIAKLIAAESLDAAFGNELAQRFVGAARELAQFYVARAATSDDGDDDDDGDLEDAREYLARADAQALAQHWASAMDRYKSALHEAQDAIDDD